MTHYERWLKSQQMNSVSKRFHDRYDGLLHGGWEKTQFKQEAKLADYSNEMEKEANNEKS